MYQRRRDLVLDALAKIGIEVPSSRRRTIYVWAKVPEGYTSASFAEKILEDANVIVAAGSAYGPSGEGYIRISLTTPDDRLEAAIERIEDVTLRSAPLHVRTAPLPRNRRGPHRTTAIGRFSSASTAATSSGRSRSRCRNWRRLADTAEVEVVATLTQRLDRPHPSTFIGAGKADEIAEARRETSTHLVIFDDELTPSQQLNLENLLPETAIIDRTALILEIFAMHAISREGKLQVELAQQEYVLPRLRGIWGHLDKYARRGQ